MCDPFLNTMVTGICMIISYNKPATCYKCVIPIDMVHLRCSVIQVLLLFCGLCYWFILFHGTYGVWYFYFYDR